ncbi:MAG: glycosyltransferase family 2 protein [Proteobacteria bacterium]|nr:glycosyltransferase family 2 protein [Pseudomonadota bacterium]
MNRKKLSIVIPVYNEEQAIPYLKTALLDFGKTLPMELEVVLVNDGSSDNTKAMLHDWKHQQSGIVVCDLLVNTGHQQAIQSGLELATGDYVVTMDADLQDPVPVIFDFIRKSEEGFDVVHSRRISRKNENTFRKVAAWIFYRLAKRLLNQNMLLDVGDFRLVTREALQQYLILPDRKFVRGEIIQLQVPQAVVSYHREGRVAGVSKFSFRKLLELAWMSVRFKPFNTASSNQVDDKAQTFRSL